MSASSATITGAAPTLSLIDTDAADFSIHVNAGVWNIRNEAGTGIVYTDQTGNLTAAGNITAYSDARLKTNINTIESALDKVLAMRGVSFTKDGNPGMGVIAQEVELIVPEVVQNNQDGYKSVAYGNLVGVLIEAIKEFL